MEPQRTALHVIAQRLPAHWSLTRRRAVILLASPLLLGANFGVVALALTGGAPLLESPHVLVLIVPALAYGALLRFGPAVPRQ